MPRPAIVENQLREAFEALKAEGKVPTQKDVADRAKKKALVWSKYPKIRGEIQQYSSVHHKVKKNKKDKNKNYSKNLRKKNQELENKLRIVTNLLEAYLETVNVLRRDLELERRNVKNLR